jgi:hypothetical protein
MNISAKIGRLFSLVMWLIALHSFFVGIGLIFLPESFLVSLGFSESEEIFFRMQGGVFHILMSVLYGIAATNVNKFTAFINFSIFAKIVATVFLLFFFIIVTRNWVVLVSGIVDFLMAVIIWKFHSLNKKALKEKEEEKPEEVTDTGGELGDKASPEEENRNQKK